MASFQQDKTELAYLVSLLDGDAWTWYSNKLKEFQRSKPGAGFTFIGVAAAVLAFYRDGNKQALAARKLILLYQGRMACTDYTLRFMHLANLTSWDDSVCRQFYKRGLNDEIKNILVQHTEPFKTLQELA